jgi:Rad3-related DNA helicase
MALKERLSIIQGPPGCGKTLVVTAIVANWMKNLKKVPRILVCAPSNTAADFIAERLFQIPKLQDKVIRFYPDKREDVFNINVDKLKPYHMLFKILFMDKEWQSSLAQEIQGVDYRLRDILSYVNFYFSEENLATSHHMRQLINKAND